MRDRASGGPAGSPDTGDQIVTKINAATTTIAASGRITGVSDSNISAASLTNASLAAMDISDGPSDPALAPMLGELEESTQRAQVLYEQIRRFDDDA